jgi:hypothetical protein
MEQIKKIISMCPAPPGWMAYYEDEDPAPVAAWVLVELQDSSQEIIPMTGIMSGDATIDKLNWELNNYQRYCLSNSRI